MHAAQILKTDDAFEGGEGFFAGFGAAQVVAGGESMAGINADADAGFIFHAVDDGARCSNLKPRLPAGS